MESFKQNNPSFTTKSIHVGFEPSNNQYGAVIPPITLATVYKQDEPDSRNDFFYARLGNPSRTALEKSLASMEEMQYDSAKTVSFGSGTAAIAAVIQLLQNGDHLLASKHLYAGTIIYFSDIASRQNIEVTYIDCSSMEEIRKSIKKNTKMIWVESPSNPTLQVLDLQLISDTVKEFSHVERIETSETLPVLEQMDDTGILLVVDNTFLTPYFQRPLEIGAHIVVNSCTKYLNGSSDVCMGAVSTCSDVLHNKLCYIQIAAGAIPSAFDCYILQRSLRTLGIRMQRHMENGLAVATFLEANSFIKRVMHPGLKSHPDHQIALKQTFGYSGMVSFYLREDDLEKSRVFVKRLRVITLGTSFGGVESIIELPLTMSHATMTHEDNMEKGVTAGLMRLSVGLEDAKDLIGDLDQALKAAFE